MWLMSSKIPLIKFELFKKYISQTIDPIDDPFLPLAYLRRDLGN
jgi:hypothetical protein